MWIIQGEGERVDGCPLTFSFSKPWAAILCQPLDTSPEISLGRCYWAETDGTMEGRFKYIHKESALGACSVGTALGVVTGRHVF